MNESIFKNTMAEMTWKELEEKGKQNIPVLFPLGVIEEHGPQLPLGTDIYMSCTVCSRIREVMLESGQECLIAPPYYWGINHCTGGFPGSFSVRRETMRMILKDIFLNLRQFGFHKIICVNLHGDPVHTAVILEAVREADVVSDMDIRLLVEPYSLRDYGLSGEEDYILVDEAEYSPELFPNSENELDIHAGAYETAAMMNYYPDLVREMKAKELADESLTYENFGQWAEGGEAAKQVVPLGYAGNPAEYQRHIENMGKVYDIMCRYAAQKMIKL